MQQGGSVPFVPRGPFGGTASKWCPPDYVPPVGRLLRPRAHRASIARINASLGARSVEASAGFHAALHVSRGDNNSRMTRSRNRRASARTTSRRSSSRRAAADIGNDDGFEDPAWLTRRSPTQRDAPEGTRAHVARSVTMLSDKKKRAAGRSRWRSRRISPEGEPQVAPTIGTAATKSMAGRQRTDISQQSAHRRRTAPALSRIGRGIRPEHVRNHFMAATKVELVHLNSSPGL